MDEGDDLQRILERAGALFDIDRYADAIVLYEQALSLAPDNPYVMTCLAQSLRFAGDHAGCKEYAERAVQSDPEFSWPYRELALLRLYANDVGGAYELATTSVQLMPENVLALHLLGRCAYAMDRYEEVRYIADVIFDIAPDEIEGHDLHALVAEEEGTPADVVRHLQTALEIDPENAVLIEKLANAQRQLRQSDASTTYYHAALNADPHDRAVQASLKDSLHRLALFGERHHRMRSPAAWLGLLTVVYLAAWLILLRLIDDADVLVWVNRLGFIALPAVAILLVLLIRKRFIAEHFPQLAIGYQMLRSEARREYIIGIPIVLACMLGISIVLYRAQVSIEIALLPIWLPIVIIWLSVLTLIIGVLRAMLTDRAIGERKDLTEIAVVVGRWNLLFDVALGATLFAASVLWYSSLALLGA
ncbi:MAG: hypothetical protein WBN09_05265, partial [Woeseiaceae bacterium]